MNAHHFHDSRSGSAVHVRVQPKSGKNEVAAILEDGTVKIRLTAPAHEGKANQALITFLADQLKVPATSIEIVAGLKNRDKLITIVDLTASAIERKLRDLAVDDR